MRNVQTPIISFTDANGNIFPVRDITDIPVYQTVLNLPAQKGMMPDELVTRAQFAGANAEFLTYKIIEANAVNLLEEDFDFTHLRSIIIPDLRSLF